MAFWKNNKKANLNATHKVMNFIMDKFKSNNL